MRFTPKPTTTMTRTATNGIHNAPKIRPAWPFDCLRRLIVETVSVRRFMGRFHDGAVGPNQGRAGAAAAQPSVELGSARFDDGDGAAPMQLCSLLSVDGFGGGEREPIAQDGVDPVTLA
ncbi:hypothetical protein ADUPG1_007557, partial [Aduncisulcus paluster]